MSDDYEIGYGKPPKRTQFRKGQSGNPKGRPKGAKSLKTELEEELREWIVVREGGKSKKITKRRAMIKSQTAKACQGDSKAFAQVTNIDLRDSDNDPTAETRTEDLAEEDQAIIESYVSRNRQREPDDAASAADVEKSVPGPGEAEAQ